MANCNDNNTQLEIIRRINKAGFSGYYQLFVTSDFDQEKMINKLKGANNVFPGIVKIAQFNGNPDVLACFMLNRQTLQILGIYKPDGTTLITKDDLIPNSIIDAQFKFKYGTIEAEQYANLKLYVREYDYFQLGNCSVYSPKWFAILLEQENMTFIEFKDYLVQNVLSQFLWKCGLNPNVILQEDIDYKVQYSIIPDPNPNRPIWDDPQIILPPFKRKNIQFSITIVAKDESKYVNDFYDFKIVAYQKLDLNDIKITDKDFQATSIHDTWQDAIDTLTNTIAKEQLQNAIDTLVNENYWIYDKQYPEFKWNYGADFVKEINNNLNQLEFSIKDKNPNDLINQDEKVTFICNTKSGINTYENQFSFQVNAKIFHRYQLNEIIFSTYKYNAKSFNDTYHDALSGIKDEIRNLIVYVFKNENITNYDFILSTNNEHTKITKDETILVNVKANPNSDWLVGENQFQLELKKFIVQKPFRQFKLINNLQQEIDLQDLNLILGSNPNDLGISYKNDFLQIENNFIFTQKNSNLNNINFTLTFLTPNAYDKYYSFINFLVPNINANQSLILNYKIFYNNQSFNKDYNCEIFFKGINKTELNNLGNLEVQINFEKVSNWKNLIIQQLEFESNTLELTNNGQLPAPTMIQIIGSSINPYFILKNENDQTLSESKIDYTFENSDILIIDAKVTEQKVIVQRNNQNINIFDKQDFTKDTFIFIPPGKSKLIYQNKKESERIYVSFEEQYLSI